MRNFETIPNQFYGRLLDTTQQSLKFMMHFPEGTWEYFRVSNKNTAASFWRLFQYENYLLHILSFLFTDTFDFLLVPFLYQYHIVMFTLLFLTLNLFRLEHYWYYLEKVFMTQRRIWNPANRLRWILLRK